MGAFLVNFHVRTRSVKKVSNALQQINVADAWIATPKGKWVSFWEREASRQSERCIQRLLGHVSKSLAVPAIAFLVHDSDVLRFWLYEDGNLVCGYNSNPGYYPDTVVDPEPLAEKCRQLVKWCRAATDVGKLESILVPTSVIDQSDTIGASFESAETRLHQLSPLLGIAEDRLIADFNDFENEFDPEELGATRFSTNQASDSNADEDPIGAWSRKSPLFTAIISGDMAAIEQLAANGCNLNEVLGDSEITALAFAVANSSVNVVRKLIELGANPNNKTQYGISPLRQAVDCEKADMIRALAESGADVNEFHPEVGSLLHIAIFHQRLSIIPVLIEINVDRQLKNPKGLTPREFAAASAEALRNTIRELKKSVPNLPAKSLSIFSEQIEQMEKVQQILS